MCGIAGLINVKDTVRDNRGDMQRMRDRMRRRGPDGGGTWVSGDGRCTLGHQRLSILDLSDNGAQPMLSHSGRSAIVFNGEIYNYAEVKAQLTSDLNARGQASAFRSTCDTEVLQEAIEFYGLEKTLTLCKGMFALGIYDSRTQTLQLARDRVGEKPLYYGWLPAPGESVPAAGSVSPDAGADGRGAGTGSVSSVTGAARGTAISLPPGAGAFAEGRVRPGSRFVFASDVGSIRATEGFCSGINEDVLDLYCEHGVIPTPYSIYRGIYKLLPGTILTIRAPFTADSAQIRPYWSMTDAAVRGQHSLFRGTRQEAADELERLLRAAIRGQMIADVPLGAFLSAGIDSTTIVSLMQEESPLPVRTFTIGMNETQFNEAIYAKEIAQHLGTDHTELYISEDDAKAVIPLLPHMFSEPFADSSQIPTYLVSRMTREHVTVSLSGDAGDELFCGYNSYPSAARKWDKMGRIPLALRRPAGRLLARTPLARRQVWQNRARILQAESPEAMHRLASEMEPLTESLALHRGKLPYAFTETGSDVLGEVYHDAMLMDLQMYHPDDILVKVDRTAMAVSLETRVPLLDRDVVEFAWTLPLEYLRRDGTGKLVLRDVLYRRVPEEMVNRPKKGFSIPIRTWLRDTQLRGWAEDLLAPDRIRAQGLFSPEAVRRIWEEFTQQGRWRPQIWYLLMFQAWYEEEYRSSL